MKLKVHFDYEVIDISRIDLIRELKDAHLDPHDYDVESWDECTDEELVEYCSEQSDILESIADAYSNSPTALRLEIDEE